MAIKEQLLDLEDLASSASRRRKVDSEATFKQPEWKCVFCGKVLANETYFMRHQCKEKARSEELSTPIGTAAYSFYCEWMKSYKRKAPSIETFATSRYYTAFVEFAKHVKKLGINNPQKFLELMCDRDISPMLWRRDQCYSMYLEWIDRKQDPLEQVQDSIVTLLDIAEKEDINPVSEVFTRLGQKRICELIRLRKLSPWFLFCSLKFNDFAKSLPRADADEISAVINPQHWVTKLQENKPLIKDILEINKEMGF